MRLVSFRKACVRAFGTGRYLVLFVKTNVRTAVSTTVTTFTGLFTGMIKFSHKNLLLFDNLIICFFGSFILKIPLIFSHA